MSKPKEMSQSAIHAKKIKPPMNGTTTILILLEIMKEEVSSTLIDVATYLTRQSMIKKYNPASPYRR